jgi:DNA-binding transcriptional LysR family regulator
MRGTEFAELSAFISVADRGSFARAAEDLGIVPSTLSQTIRSLEDRLGVRLLNRTTRSVSLTQAGEKLHNRIRPAFTEMNSAVESLSDFRDTPTGTLRLSVSTIPAQGILAPMLKDFLDAYPGIRLDVTVDNTNSDIVSGRFDAGIRYGRKIEQDMILVQASKPSRIVTVAAPSYLELHGTPKTPEDLQKHACILYRQDTQTIPWEFERNKKKINVVVTGPFTANDVDLNLKAVRAGIGIGYMIESYIADDISSGTLVPVLREWSPHYHGYYLYYTDRRQLPVPLRVFIDFLNQRNFNKQQS